MVASGGTLDLNGFNQTVSSLTNAGLVNMGTGAAPGTVLTTTNYTGTGGTMAINTVLGGDGSPSDRLVISGGTASGNTTVHVTNAGGPGAETSGNGIQVVNTIERGDDGSWRVRASAGEVRAGAFDYDLFRAEPASQPKRLVPALRLRRAARAARSLAAKQFAVGAARVARLPSRHRREPPTAARRVRLSDYRAGDKEVHPTLDSVDHRELRHGNLLGDSTGGVPLHPTLGGLALALSTSDRHKPCPFPPIVGPQFRLAIDGADAGSSVAARGRARPSSVHGD